MAYSKQTWANDDPTTPIDADRLTHIEAGIEAAASAADAAATAKVAKTGDTMSGDLAMGGHRVTGLADPAAAQDAATRAYVLAQITALVNSAPGILDTLGEIAAALQADESAAATLTALVATKAPLASPALTGTPTVNGATVEDRTHAAATYAPLTETVETFAAAGAAITFGDPTTTGTMKDVTLTADLTVTLPAPVKAPILARFTQGGAGGWKVTFVLASGGSPKWGASGVPPTLTPAAGAQDEVEFHSWGATWTGGMGNKDIR